MREFDARVIAGTTPTSTGTKDFDASVPVGGSPEGAVVYCVRTDGTDDFEPGCSMSVGFADGTDSAVNSFWSKDNVGTAVSKNRGDEDKVIRLYDPDDNSLIVEATFDSWHTDGIRLDFTTVDSTAWRVVVYLFFGTDCDCGVYNFPPASEGDRVGDATLGFTPSFIIGTGIEEWNDVLRDDMAWRMHMAIDPSSVTQCEGDLASGDALTTTRSRNINRTDRIGYWYDIANPIGVGQETEVTGFTAVGISAENFAHPGDIGNSLRYFGLAVRASDRSVMLDVGQQVPASTGDVSHGTFKPAFVSLILMGNTNNAAIQGFGFMSHGASDFLEEHHVSLHDRNNTGTSVTDSRYDDRAVQLYNAFGNRLIEGNIDTRSQSDFDISFDFLSGSQRRYHVLAVEEQPFEASGSPTYPAMTATGTANVVVNQDATTAELEIDLPATVQEIEAVQATDEMEIDLPAAEVAVVVPGTTAELEIDLPASVREIEAQPATLEEEIDLPATTRTIELGSSLTELEIDLPAAAVAIEFLQNLVELEIDLPAVTLSEGFVAGLVELEIDIPTSVRELLLSLTTSELEILLGATGQLQVEPATQELEIDLPPVTVETTGGDTEIALTTLELELEIPGPSIAIEIDGTTQELEIAVSGASELDIPLTTLEAVIETLPPEFVGQVGEDVLITVGLDLWLVLGDYRVVNGQTYYFQKERIHNKLLSLAQLGLFFPVEYDKSSDVMGIDGLDTAAVNPQSIETNETLARVGVSIRNRSDGRRDRQSWTWELLLDFQEEVALEIFEKELMLEPPILPKDTVRGLQQVTLNLVDIGYDHPPEHEATSGTQAKLTFDAALGPT